jgi:hypothetical protein
VTATAWAAVIVFITAYVLIATERVHRVPPRSAVPR